MPAHNARLDGLGGGRSRPGPPSTRFERPLAKDDAAALNWARHPRFQRTGDWARIPASRWLRTLNTVSRGCPLLEQRIGCTDSAGTTVLETVGEDTLQIARGLLHGLQLEERARAVNAQVSQREALRASGLLNEVNFGAPRR